MEGFRRPGRPPFPSRVEAFERAFAQEADAQEHVLSDVVEALSKKG